MKSATKTAMQERKALLYKLSSGGLKFPITQDELRTLIFRYTRRRVKARGIQYWFKFCRVRPIKGRGVRKYFWSDVAKLVVFGHYLNQCESFELAQQMLIEDVSKDYGFFFPDDEFYKDESDSPMPTMDVEIKSIEVISFEEIQAA